MLNGRQNYLSLLFANIPVTLQDRVNFAKQAKFVRSLVNNIDIFCYIDD